MLDDGLQNMGHQDPCYSTMRCLLLKRCTVDTIGVSRYAVIVGRFTWKKYLDGRKAISFVDNESAKEALVKGTSHNGHFRSLLLQMEVAEQDLRAWLWISRVPSHSNPSDGPSRGDVALMTSLNATRDGCSCPILGCLLDDL